MKLIRHQTASGPAYAALQPDGSLREVSGDILGSFTVTERVVKQGKLLAPIVPSNILAIGLNYRQHAIEVRKPLPEWPMLFITSTNTLQNPGDPIELPVKLASSQVDFECELAVVIGKTCKNVPKAKALDYVLGYTCANDISARDWQNIWNGGQYCQGKSFDTFCPLGPILVTSDEITNPNTLRIRTVLNGATLQDSNTSDMVFDVPTLIEFLSGSKTLLAGTVILTGTPQGVGVVRTPPVFLKPGDSITVDIERIGSLTNPVVAERP